MSNHSKNMKIRAGSLFSGIGGFCLGFGRAGIPTAWAVENDSHAKETYLRNIDNVRFLHADIQKVSVRKNDLEPVEVLHAGFPCQSFSQAGGRRGFDDPRGRLFFEIPRIISEFKDKRPKVIVLENSPFLRYGEGGVWFLELQKQIQQAGYWFRDSNCAELNAFDLTPLPQQRVRLYMVALSVAHFGSGKFEFPFEPDPTPKRLASYIDFDGIKDDNYYLHEENRYYRMISNKVRDKRSLYQLRKYEVRVKERDTCPTLTANMGVGGHNVPFVLDRRGLRKLTEGECLLLQGFPEEFRFPDHVPRHSRYTQVGNAVTVPVAELLARKVKKKLTEFAGSNGTKNRIRVSG